MAVDTSQVAQLDVEPGELPATMAAWVIREERQGEPLEAFQLEEMAVPEPGAFEVVVRVMAAGVNFNNVWAALGKPVSVFRYHDEDHHIGGSDASGIVWKVGEGVTRWKPGDEVVLHCNQASYEDVEVHGLDPLAAPVPADLGLRDDLGLVRPVLQGPGPAVPAQAGAPDLGGGGLLRADLLHRLPDADRPGADPERRPGADLGRRRRARRVRDPALPARRAPTASASSPPRTKGELCRSLGACDVIDRNDFAGMMRRGDETPEEEAARAKESRRFAKHVRGAARRGARRRVRARRPRDVPHVAS